MIIDKFKEGWTMRSISSIFDLPQITWRKILSESKFNMKKKKVSETQNKLPYKIEQRDIDIVREYFEINVYKKMTLESLWTFLKEKKIGGTQLSKSGVRYLVTQFWSIRIREHIFSQSKMTNNDRVRDFCDAASLLLFLEKSGYHLIFVDEFHVSMHSSSLYNWSPRGYPSIMPVDLDPWVASFVVAVSKRKIEGIVVSTGSINKKSFAQFKKDIWNGLNEENSDDPKGWFIMDNSSVHKNEHVIKTVENQRIRCITIPLYSLRLNAAEKIIAVLKAKKRQKWIATKQLNLSLIKSIVYGIQSETWRKWVESSITETLQKLRIMKIRL